MPIVKLDTGFNIEVEFPVALFWKRLLAWTIDVLICWMITKALALMLQVDSFFCVDERVGPARSADQPPRSFLSFTFWKWRLMEEARAKWLCNSG